MRNIAGENIVTLISEKIAHEMYIYRRHLDAFVHASKSEGNKTLRISRNLPREKSGAILKYLHHILEENRAFIQCHRVTAALYIFRFYWREIFRKKRYLFADIFVMRNSRVRAALVAVLRKGSAFIKPRWATWGRRQAEVLYSSGEIDRAF